MTRAHIIQLVRRIALTCETEIDCGECSHLSAAYAEAVLNGQASVERWSVVRAHLEQCSVCAEEFSGLCQITQADMDGNWPSISLLLERLSESNLNA